MGDTRIDIPPEQAFNALLDKLTHADSIATEDIIEGLSSLGLALGDAIPQINFVGGTLYTSLIPELLTAIKSTLTLSQPPSIGIAWNGLDALMQFIIGVILLYLAITGKTHTPISMGIDGGINIGSSIQLIVLTILSAPLAAIGFAVAFGVAAIMAIKNTLISFGKCVNEEYWIKDSLEILALSRKNHAEDLREKKEQIERIYSEIEKLEKEKLERSNFFLHAEDPPLTNAALANKKPSPEKLNFFTNSALNFIKNRLRDTHQDIQNLQTEIFARLITDYVENEESYLRKTKDTSYLEQFTPEQKSCFEELKNHKQIYPEPKNKYERGRNRIVRENFVNEILPKHQNVGPSSTKLFKTYQECHDRTQQSKLDYWQALGMKAIDTLYICMAFVGMVFACIPALHFISPAFTAPAAAYFAGKYGPQTVSAVKSVYGFFSAKEDRKEIKEEIPIAPLRTAMVMN